jgi:glycosyltransferase involved in cell wall biosynthesis
MKANKEKKPLISIVIACYNQGIYLMDALNSAISQIYKNTEIIIVNDGSTDEYTVDLLKNLKKKGLRIIDQANQGPSGARNTGIKNSKGEYILPLDADNKLDPNFLMKTYKYLENDKIGIVYVWMKCFGESEEIRKWPEYDFKKLLLNNYIETSSLFRKKDWEAVGGFKKMKYFGIEDWDFFMSISELGLKGVCIKELLSNYRVRSDSMIHALTRNIDNYLSSVKELYNNHKDSYNKYGCYVFSEYTKTQFLTNKIKQKDKEIKQRNDQINKKGRIIEQQNKQIKIREKDVYKLRNELNNIQNSYSWKLTSLFRKINWAIKNPKKCLLKYKNKLKI